MKKDRTTAGVLVWLLGLVGCGKAPSQEYETVEVYRTLRDHVLTLDPTTVGLSPGSPEEVWGLVMETGYPEAVATLVAIADGTVSLYFSSGGGIIGVGHHDGPRQACKNLLTVAPKFVEHASPVNEFPLPAQGNTRFYFLTSRGALGYEAKEDDLGNDRLPLSPLFYAAHELITEARLIDEQLSDAEMVRRPR